MGKSGEDIRGKQEGGQFKGRKGFCYDARKAKVRPGNVSMGNELFTETVLGSLKNQGLEGILNKG